MILQGKDHISCNAIMISKPGHRFWRLVMEMMQMRRYSRDPVDSTGPRMLQRAFDRWQREPWISELPDAERVVLLPAEYFYPKLALWNRRDIFVGPCLQNVLATKLRRAGRDMQQKAKAICATMVEVGWERYSDGYLYGNRWVSLALSWAILFDHTLSRHPAVQSLFAGLFIRTYAVHQWFFNWVSETRTRSACRRGIGIDAHIWSVCVMLCVVLACQGMGRKTYHPDALIDIESVIGLAHNDSFQPNTTEYIRRYGTKVRTNKTSTNVEAVMEKTCIGWRQTASCRPNGRRESRHGRPCDQVAPK